MITVINRYLPRRGFTAMTIWPLVFASRELTDRERRHEGIHGRQQVETMLLTAGIMAGLAFGLGGISPWWMLLVPGMFYVLYVLEWAVRLIIYRDRTEACRNISSEQEAYLHQDDADYAAARRPFCWTGFLFRKTWRKTR